MQPFQDTLQLPSPLQQPGGQFGRVGQGLANGLHGVARAQVVAAGLQIVRGLDPGAGAGGPPVLRRGARIGLEKEGTLAPAIQPAAPRGPGRARPREVLVLDPAALLNSFNPAGSGSSKYQVSCRASGLRSATRSGRPKKSSAVLTSE